jgi:murein DD-endopeptidase MepM/ murein hydrolase activator NlpD
MKRLLIAVLIVLLLILIIPSAVFVVGKYRETLPVPNGAVNMKYPLKNGKYLVTASGHFFTIHATPIEKYALDIVRFPSVGSYFKFHQTDLRKNETYNTPVYSPCTGNIRKMRDGIDDQPIGIKSPEEGGGNFVVIRCPNFDVMMAHFKKGSFKIKLNDKVQVGEEIALIGNSGNTDGPHLHIMAYLTNDSTGEHTPLPITFGGRYLRSLDSFSQGK